MFKTHKKSKIFRIAEKDLKTLDGVVIQLERIPETINGYFYCIVEVVPQEDYDSEMEHDKTLKTLNELREIHERLCESILCAFGSYENSETAEIQERKRLAEALDLANNWF